MNYIINLYTLLFGSSQLLMGNDQLFYLLLMFSGLALASILWLFCAFFGSLFYKPYRLSIGQHILCGLLTVMVVVTVPTYVSAVYLQPTLAGLIANWRDTLISNTAWNNKQFIRQYDEIKKMGLEDFSNYPAPARGGTLIPLNHTESLIKVGQMNAEATIENFYFNFPLISKIIGTKPTVSANRVSQDMNDYFKTNKSSTYPHERGIQLAVDQIYKELEPQIPRIIFLIRLTLALATFIGYALCLGWIAYAALCQIRIYSAHHSSSSQL